MCPSLIPRPSHLPVYDHLQQYAYCKQDGGYSGLLILVSRKEEMVYKSYINAWLLRASDDESVLFTLYCSLWFELCTHTGRMHGL